MVIGIGVAILIALILFLVGQEKAKSDCTTENQKELEYKMLVSKYSMLNYVTKSAMLDYLLLLLNDFNATDEFRQSATAKLFSHQSFDTIKKEVEVVFNTTGMKDSSYVLLNDFVVFVDAEVLPRVVLCICNCEERYPHISRQRLISAIKIIIEKNFTLHFSFDKWISLIDYELSK